jgi:DNA polymerase-3 subunit delta
MRISAEQLEAHTKDGMRPVYVVYGEEILLAEEACARIRKAALAHGYDEREVLTVERGFDWARLQHSSESMSLFSQRRVIELRMPGSKPGDAGSKALIQYCEHIPDDTVLLLWCGKLDRAQLNSKWFKALDQAGGSIGVSPVEASRLPQWIESRMRAQELKPGAGVSELLAYHFEGNLLALAQEIEKLGLTAPGETVSVEDVQLGLGDNARFNVFGFVDTCLAGNGPEAVRALSGLRADGTAATLVLWALTREIRQLQQCAVGIEAGESESSVFSRFRIWQKKQGLYRSALRRGRSRRWQTLLQAAARADRSIKGRAAGNEWQALQVLGLALAGVRISG